MTLEIQSIEENKWIIEEAQNIVHKDERTIEDLTNRSEKLEKETHEAFIKFKPRSKIQKKQKKTTKIEIFIKTAIIVIFIIPIIVIVHFTSIQFSKCLLSTFYNYRSIKKNWI